MSEATIGNSGLVAAVNSRLVLQAVRLMQPTYRAAVARHTGLRPATVTSIVNTLLDERLLTETESPNLVSSSSDPPPDSRWGRPPLMLCVNGNVKRVLAIDLEPDRVRIALTNIMLDVLGYHELPIDRFAGHEDVLQRVIALCRELLKGVQRGQLQGVGVSLPGLIDRENGVLISSTNMPQWKNVPVARILGDALKADVRVERSVHLAAMYEQWGQRDSDGRTVLLVSLRTGVGMSLMHRGELFTGRSGFDGEIGHTVVDVDGRTCECGGRGCLETFVSASAICNHARELIDQGQCPELAKRIQGGEALRPELIYLLASEGDAPCARIVDHVGRYLGIGIANMINLLAPHEVVIAGSIDIAGELLLASVRHQIEQRVLPRMRERVIVRLAREREKLPLLGAAVLVAQDWFQLPRLRHADVEAQVTVPARTWRTRSSRKRGTR